MNKKRTVLWSHVFFLAPLAIALANHLFTYSLVIAIAVVVSYKFHLHPKSRWHALDRITALALIGSNFYLFYLTTFATYYFVAAIALAAVAFVFFFKASKHEYYHYHALWHFFCALITICSVVGYVNHLG